MLAAAAMGQVETKGDAGGQSSSIEAPRATPLVVNNPFLSAWSMRDRLTDDWPRHWTSEPMGMVGMVMIDGKAYRWCGIAPAGVPALTQKRVEVSALQSVYTFEGGGVEVQVIFVSPVFVEDAVAASFSGSVVYVGIKNTDTKPHTASMYMDISGEWCTHTPYQSVTWSRARTVSDLLVSMAVSDQRPLARVGDRVRIDWGRVYLAQADTFGTSQLIASDSVARGGFARFGTLSGHDDLGQPRPASDRWPVLATSKQFGRLEPGQTVETFVVIAYDEGRSVEFLERPLKPYWAGKGERFEEALGAFCRDDQEFEEAVRAEDARVRAAALAVGNEKFAEVCELAYRQTMGGHAIAADIDGTMLMFSKENTSNGCIGTVDVTFPSAPFFLWGNPEMLAAQVRPIFIYASMPHRWKFPFAPHDLGTFPKANGQVYGGGETSEVAQMPVEESANMLILTCALVQARGKPGMEFVEKYWEVLTTWANYLKEHGLDPAEQLCTDDFAGPMARNANLSLKSVIGLGAYAQMCEARGDKDKAVEWRTIAEQQAKEWMQLAKDEGGGTQTVLRFGEKGTWSLKYNLIWDEILGTKLFPASLAEREVAWYLKMCNEFGPPLDSRETYTKLDFVAWAAALATRREDFTAIMDRVHEFTVKSPSRVPMGDWYDTKNGESRGFHARSVVGGVYARMLLDGAWKREKESQSQSLKEDFHEPIKGK